MGVVMIFLGQLSMAFVAIFIKLPFSKNLLFVAVSLIYYLGMALFLTNYIQFGLDQLLSESSSRLQSYVYWLVGLLHLSCFIVSMISAILTKIVAYDILVYFVKALNGISYPC